jgi:hypothetical protein
MLFLFGNDVDPVLREVAARRTDVQLVDNARLYAGD